MKIKGNLLNEQLGNHFDSDKYYSIDNQGYIREGDKFFIVNNKRIGFSTHSTFFVEYKMEAFFHSLNPENVLFFEEKTVEYDRETGIEYNAMDIAIPYSFPLTLEYRGVFDNIKLDKYFIEYLIEYYSYSIADCFDLDFKKESAFEYKEGKNIAGTTYHIITYQFEVQREKEENLK